MDGQGSFLRLVDFTKNVDVNDFFANHSAYYTYHDIIDGERPDTVSYRLYQNPDYYWTFFILNNNLRGGLNTAWPLSSNQFDRMIEAEYDKYSAITLLPENESINGIGISGLMQLTRLHAEYLPYLRLSIPNGSETAKILKYDASLLQIIVSDIKRDGLPPLSRDSYTSAPYYRLIWINPYETTSDAYVLNIKLKKDFITRQLSIYSEFDSGAIIDPDTLTELPSQADIDAAIAARNESYVFSKRYIPASNKYIWKSYRDAAAEYYTSDNNNKSISRSAFDILSDVNVIIPQYISNHEKEERINNNKEKIRVLRPDKINDFIDAYFNLINSN